MVQGDCSHTSLEKQSHTHASDRRTTLALPGSSSETPSSSSPAASLVQSHRMAPKANPRRDDQVHRYERPKPASEEEGGSTGTGGEFYNLMSMMLGIAGLMMRVRPPAATLRASREERSG